MESYRAVFVLVLLITAACTLILWQVLMWPEEVKELRFCAKYETQDVGPQINAETSNEYGSCGYSEAPSTPPQYWSLNKLVVLRSAFWDTRQFKGLQQGYWVLLIEAEKRIVKEKLLVGVQIGNHTYSDIRVHVLNWNRRYIDHACKQLTHWYLLLRSYREIGGQKDYAVFGHCVIQCP